MSCPPAFAGRHALSHHRRPRNDKPRYPLQCPFTFTDANLRQGGRTRGRTLRWPCSPQWRPFGSFPAEARPSRSARAAERAERAEPLLGADREPGGIKISITPKGTALINRPAVSSARRAGAGAPSPGHFGREAHGTEAARPAVWLLEGGGGAMAWIPTSQQGQTSGASSFVACVSSKAAESIVCHFSPASRNVSKQHRKGQTLSSDVDAGLRRPAT